MLLVRLIPFLVVVLLTAQSALSDQKKEEPKKVMVKTEDLVGTWNPKDAKPKVNASLTFMKDGKFEQAVPQKGGTLFLKGKYKIDDGKLILSVELGKGYEEIFAINEYREDFLSITKGKGKTVEYTRKVEKK